MTDEGQPPLFDGEPERCALCYEPGHTHDDHWLFDYPVIRAVAEKGKALQAAHDTLRAERDDWHKLADERSAEIVRLEAELRKYEPSDGVMQQRLAMTEAIQKAAPLIEALYTLLCDRVIGDPRGPLTNASKAWLALPIVVSALNEAKR